MLSALLLALSASSSLAFSLGPNPTVTGRAACTPAAATQLPTLASRSFSLRASEDAAEAAPSAFIEFILGFPEPVVPDVALTRSKDGSTGVATFTFDNPSFLAAASAELGETTGAAPKHAHRLRRTGSDEATLHSRAR